MANYAYVVDGNIEEIHDTIPTNWKNVSNFYILTEEERLTLGWYTVIKLQPEYDPNTQSLGYVTQYFSDNAVYETTEVIDSVTPTVDTYAAQQAYLNNTEAQWDRVRTTRYHLMQDIEWRYTRYDRQVRMGLPTTDDISTLDTYMQALADITTQTDPWDIVWPTPI
jgi:hypothetical protein